MLIGLKVILNKIIKQGSEMDGGRENLYFGKELSQGNGILCLADRPDTLLVYLESRMLGIEMRR